MIKSQNTSIADVKYGSQQLVKICKGTDLVWEKDGWMTLKIGTPHSEDSAGIILAKCYSYTQSTPPGGAIFKASDTGAGASFDNVCGFSLVSGRAAHGAEYCVLACFDGLAAERNGYAESGYSSATTLTFTMTFPFDVNVVSVTGYKYVGVRPDTQSTNPKHPTGMKICSRTADGAFSDSTKIADNVSFGGNNSATMLATQNNENIRALQFTLTGYPSDNNKRVFGEFRMEVQVKRSDYMSWKRQYISSFASGYAIP